MRIDLKSLVIGTALGACAVPFSGFVANRMEALADTAIVATITSPTVPGWISAAVVGLAAVGIMLTAIDPVRTNRAVRDAHGGRIPAAGLARLDWGHVEQHRPAGEWLSRVCPVNPVEMWPEAVRAAAREALVSDSERAGNGPEGEAVALAILLQKRDMMAGSRNKTSWIDRLNRTVVASAIASPSGPRLQREALLDALEKFVQSASDANPGVIDDFRNGTGPFKRHGTRATRLLALIDEARRNHMHIVAASLTWMRVCDRTMWYAIRGLGAPSAHVEGMGPLAVYRGERAGVPALADMEGAVAAQAAEIVASALPRHEPMVRFCREATDHLRGSEGLGA